MTVIRNIQKFIDGRTNRCPDQLNLQDFDFVLSAIKRPNNRMADVKRALAKAAEMHSTGLKTNMPKY